MYDKNSELKVSDIKAYIQSVLAMKTIVKYDLNKKPSKKRPPQCGSSSNFDLTD